MKQDQFNDLKNLLKNNYDISFGLYLNAMSILLRKKISGDNLEQVRALLSDSNSLNRELENLVTKIKEEADEKD